DLHVILIIVTTRSVIATFPGDGWTPACAYTVRCSTSPGGGPRCGAKRPRAHPLHPEGAGEGCPETRRVHPERRRGRDERPIAGNHQARSDMLAGERRAGIGSPGLGSIALA